MDHRKLALIHIIKHELGLSDEAYRAILERVSQVRSAKDLDEEGFRRLMRYFVRSEHYRLKPGGLTMRQKLFIRHLVAGLGWNDAHFGNFLGKYYHKASINALNRKEASNVIESLKNITRHTHQNTEDNKS